MIAQLTLDGWKLADLDAFYENFPLWGSGEPLDYLFSRPSPGTQQHLADSRSDRSGIFGNTLKPQILSTLIERYQSRGYHVIEVDDGSFKKIHLAKNDNKFRIKFK